MTNTEILDGLEAILEEDTSIEITRTANSISFSKMIHNIPRPGADLFQKYDRRYTHTITLTGSEYEAKDLIEVFNLGNDKPRTGFKTGDLHDEGYYYKNGVRTEWNTDDIKEPVKEFMDKTGMKKRQPFWTGKKIALIFAVIWIPIIVATIIILSTRL